MSDIPLGKVELVRYVEPGGSRVGARAIELKSPSVMVAEAKQQEIAKVKAKVEEMRERPGIRLNTGWQVACDELLSWLESEAGE